MDSIKCFDCKKTRECKRTEKNYALHQCDAFVSNTALGKGIDDTMIEAADDYARNTELLMTRQNEYIEELKADIEHMTQANIKAMEQIKIIRSQLVAILNGISEAFHG
jgi:hypothetical protein